MEFAATITPDNVTFTGKDGKNHVIPKCHVNNAKVRDALKRMATAKKNKDTALVDKIWAELELLANVSASVNNASNGEVVIKDGNLYYNGEIVHSTLAKRIIWALSEGYDINSSINLLKNIMLNPSKRAVDELYSFLEASTMGVTDDGYILAYKRVRGDYKDIYTGKEDNSPGRTLEMPRNKVDDDKNRTCSYGYHFCSQGYLPYYGSSGRGDRIVIVKVNPRDVVSIPADYKNQKARCCKYTVIGEYSGAERDDILTSKPVWENTDINENFVPDYDEREDRPDNILEGHEMHCRLCGEAIDAAFDDDTTHHVCYECIVSSAELYDEIVHSATINTKATSPAETKTDIHANIPEDLTDEHQFNDIPSHSTSLIEEVAVTKTKAGTVKADFNFRDGMSEYGIVVEIDSNGVAQATVVETVVPPNKTED